MIIETELKESMLASPRGLVIGSFDGVHLGHRHLLHRLKALQGGKGTQAVVTFSNHPSQVLKKQTPALSLCSLEQKVRLLEGAGVHLLFLLEFTPQLAAQSYETFLTQVHKAYPFQYLVIGKGDAFGKGREGTEERIMELGRQLPFKAEYVEKLKIDGETVSSGKIREFIQAGDFKKGAKFLGRPYSVYGPMKVEGKNGVLNVKGLCLPPEGTYPVMVEKIPARATIKGATLTVTCERPLTAGMREIIFGEKDS